MCILAKRLVKGETLLMPPNSNHAENELSPLKLPQPVAVYLAAEKARNLDMLTLCFADDALVQDEGHDYRGLDAIKSWKHEVDIKYRYLAEPLKASVQGDTVTLLVRLTGDFPGSSVEVDYEFTFADNRITSLRIQ
jgi:hypothetical protein